MIACGRNDAFETFFGEGFQHVRTIAFNVR
jgi:hypothetical protein